jgi:hypothetical protein
MLRPVSPSVMGTGSRINAERPTCIARAAKRGHTGKETVMRATIRMGIVAALLLLGCDNGGGSSPGAAAASSPSGSSGGERVPNSTVHATGSGSVTAKLGPPGGSLELASGAKVEIPPGAVEGAQDFVLREAPRTTAFFNEEHERPVGPTFIFSPGVDAPEGRTIRVSIPLASYPKGWGDVAIGVESPVGAVVGADDSEHTKWDYENAKLQGGRAVAELPSANGYRMQFVLTNLEAQ